MIGILTIKMSMIKMTKKELVHQGERARINLGSKKSGS